MDELRLVEHHRPSEADHPPEGKRRLRLRVEYDGTGYCGWQRQSNGPSVQQTLEEAFEQDDYIMFRLQNIALNLFLSCNL